MESKTPIKKSKLMQYSNDVVENIIKWNTYESLIELLLELESKKFPLIANSLLKAFEIRNKNEQFMKLFGNLNKFY